MFYNFYSHTDGKAGSNGAYNISISLTHRWAGNQNHGKPKREHWIEEMESEFWLLPGKYSTVQSNKIRQSIHVSYHQLFVSAIFSLSFTSCSNKLCNRARKIHWTCHKNTHVTPHSLLNAEYSTCILGETVTSQKVTVKITLVISRRVVWYIFTDASEQSVVLWRHKVNLKRKYPDNKLHGVIHPSSPSH